MMASNNQLVASALCLCMLLYTAVSCATPPPQSIPAPTPSTTAPTPSPTAPTPLTPSTTAPTPSPSGTGLPPPPIENIPPPPPSAPAGGEAPSGGVDIHKCWSSIQRVEGCVWEIYRAIIQFRFGSIGPACCEVIVGIDENCWPKMFPFAQQLDALLKSKCGAGHA